jgi:hypothetical protein
VELPGELLGDCTGSIAVGRTKTGTIANDDQRATIIVKKIIKPTGSLTSFVFNPTGTRYGGFSLAGGQENSHS